MTLSRAARSCRRGRVAWTAGVKPHPVVAKLGLPLDDGGRIDADRYCAVQDRPGVWAIGDAAARPRPGARRASRRRRPPSTCCARAKVVGRQRRGRADRRRRASGGRSATGRSACSSTWAATRRWRATLGIRWRGFPAWFLARTYHLALMPGNARRVRLDGRLDRRAAVRARLGRARAARPSAGAARGDEEPRLEPGGEERVGGAGVRLDDGAGLHARPSSGSAARRGRRAPARRPCRARSGRAGSAS